MTAYRTAGWYLIVSLVVLAVSSVGSLAVSGNSQSGQSQCIRCHTDVKNLIRLSWEVEKVKPKPTQSPETSGEG